MGSLLSTKHSLGRETHAATNHIARGQCFCPSQGFAGMRILADCTKNWLCCIAKTLWKTECDFERSYFLYSGDSMQTEAKLKRFKKW